MAQVFAPLFHKTNQFYVDSMLPWICSIIDLDTLFKDGGKNCMVFRAYVTT